MSDSILIDILQDWHGLEFGADLSTGALRTGVETVPVQLVRHRARQDIGFLVTSGNTLTLSCQSDDALPRPVLSYRIVPAGNGSVALRHPLWDHYICSFPPNTCQPMCCDRPNIAGWERFTITGTSSAVDSSIPTSFITSIQEVVGGGMNAASLASWCEHIDDTSLADVVVAFLRLLTRDEMERFGAILLQNPKLIDRLRNAVPDDYWIKNALPKLSEWLLDRPAINSLHLDQSTDFLGRTDYGADQAPPLGFALLSQTRRLITPHKQSCVLATARDEGIYLLEWVAWHKMLGFEHIFICSNNNTDGSDSLLEALSNEGIITWINTNPGSPTRIQRKAYAAALSLVPQILDYKWTLVIDLDEYFAIDPNLYTNVRPFFDLQEARGADSVAFSWVMMTPDNHIRHTDAPMPARFSRREPPENTLIKSASQTRLSPFFEAHNPRWALQRPFRTLDASGKLLHTEAAPNKAIGKLSEKVAWIAHYFHKSLEEFVWKSSRPRGGTTNPLSEKKYDVRFLDSFIQFFDDKNTQPDSRLNPFLSKLTTEMDDLRRIPEIAAADAQVRTIFRDQIRTLIPKTKEAVRQSPYPGHIKDKWEVLLQQYETEEL